ncbi:hypothetical protein HYX07_02610 [Candidatus Woesearchaeota archaeon]|nr:hypothetical protein [Candidatus Woesearchaeota archaeon]
MQTGPTGINPGLELKIAGMLNAYHSITGTAAWYRVPVGKWDIGQVVEDIPEFAIPFGD